MEDCLFCMIAEGKIPSKKLYEDDQVVAFYDINPQAKVHFLVVPRKHSWPRSRGWKTATASSPTWARTQARP